MSINKKTYEELLSENSALRNRIKDLESRVPSENINDEECRHALDHLMEGCQVIDFNWRYLYLNDAVCIHARKTREELLGKSMMEVYPGIDKTEIFAHMSYCLKHKSSMKVENKFVYPDGVVKWFELQIQPVPQGLFLLSIDITRRKQIQIQLEEREKMLELFIQHAPTALAMFDQDMCYIQVSQRWIDEFQLGKQKLVGRSHYEVFADLPEKYHEFHRRGLKGETLTATNDEYIAADGSTQWWNWEMMPWHQHDGEIGGIIIWSEQVTAQVLADEKIKQSEAQFRTLVEQTPAITYIAALDENSTTLYTSPQVEEILGYSIADYQAEPNTWNILLHPEDRERVLKEVSLSREKNERFESEYRMITKKGEVVWLHDIGDVVLDDKGKPLFMQGLMLDVTERKQREARIQQYIERMEILLKIEDAVNSTLDLTEVLNIIMQSLATEIAYFSISVQLFHGENLEIIACDGFENPEKVLGLQFPINPGFPNYQVVMNRKYLAIDDVSKEYPLFQTDSGYYESGHIRSWLGVPIISKDIVIGMIAIDREREKPYSLDEIQMAVTIANHAAMAIDNAQLFNEAKKRLERLNSLRQIDLAIVDNFELDAMLDVLIDQVFLHLGGDAVDVLIYNPENDLLEYRVGKGFFSEEIQVSPINLGEGYSGSAAVSRKRVAIFDFSKADPIFTRMNVVEAERFCCFWATPLVVKGQVKGVLEVFNRSPYEPSDGWLNYLDALGGQAAVALNTVQLFNDLQNSNKNLIFAYDATIEGWSRAMDLRDKETEWHTQRVADLAIALARKMNLSEEEIVHARRGALLHDMGKLGIPDSILLKPGKLAAEEWEQMKTHPRLAYEMLERIDYLKPALDIPYCHHEKWDGSGYPRGLKGEEIPLAARIFAVVDVWDAVRSDRPYRPAWSKEKALAYIKELSGVQFDPQVVELFVEMVD